MISAIVVAAGKSSRMGKINKLSLPFGNSTILATVIENLLGSKIDELVLVSSEASSPIPLDESIGIIQAYNKNPELGLTSSIQAGVRKANQKNALLICLGDMPLITTKQYNYLIESYLKANRKVIIKPYRDGVGGNPALFHNSFRDDILGLKATNGAKPLVRANQQFLEKVEVNSEAFFTDIDTIEQYEAIQKTGRND